ncbi:MAG: SET domain-containing protein-lysine N-methyltransferase [Desulfobulbales bacterium]|nr:SET domain-containing protein-lysine N-methyltransferase [Desulfobulbales bacterium]
MLCIKTYLDRSVIHGIGLFAGQDITAGTLVWELHRAVDHAYTLDQWNTLKADISCHSFANLLRLSYKEDGLIYVCMDNAQFMNHSEALCNVAHYGPLKSRMYAVKHIAGGEEILCNYLSYSDADDYHARNITNRLQGGPGAISSIEALHKAQAETGTIEDQIKHE